MLHLGEFLAYRADLSTQYHARIGIFKKELDSFTMCTRVDMSGFHAYVGILIGEAHLSLQCINEI